ncbi:hypothetical protein A3A84_00370 [Candidatus Collierbacteria bacterium RIFCSPLOWO2_01_FULL_50_23]|uniref:DNA-directed DNA polymerase n=2 Tax=Candidatus Collieribacteriota TaxID=1752725 RepID=A0A1F5ES13_9BACT|nr:MAG: hypothetical protein A3D09_03475 [Candidatus Collierbacteria bacterium RIFCSPHIGHO2_02_FULL_49_10]OGD71407.1 MAG: hypothetical protein A2703_04040 [Candidatus Collierbacteria bacterium RIFCSPHIGHO2_01_FULL_50_25]OGD74085.1 MAG: hypothetical protein A3A84_00370 [Candidatus Collierbacteria bacterium RIFCSPLOWO2_01_FULL_50_23]
MITNAEIAQTLRRVAAVFDVKDNDHFRTRAYQNAANAIENLTISARDLWEQGKLTEIPGVGPNIAGHLEEWFKTGKVRHFETEMKRVPAGMFALLGIRGVGPKIAYKIADKFKLDDEKTALKKVKELIVSGKLSSLPGFGEKLIHKIQTSIESAYVKEERMLLSEALPVSKEYLDYLLSLPDVIEAQPLGSLRRRVATVGDIDLAICTRKPKEAMGEALKYKEVGEVISTGESVSRVKLKSGHEIDIKLSHPGEWGSLLQHYTGSKLHNILLRSFAHERQLSLSEHGIKDQKTGNIINVKNEKSFYAHLGLSLIPPELREGEEELELAKKNKIPSLVELSDIKGDLHMHSDFEYETSHDLGRSSLSDVLDKARDLSYEYIGLADHNPKFQGLSIAHKKKVLDARKNKLLTQYREYEKRVKTRVPKLLIGLEIDIRKDGELALEEELISDLDYAIASIHSNFELSKAENTTRIIKALGHSKVVILGHPTGRMLNQRNSIEADWQAIIEFCKVNKKVLEVNGAPARLDLPDDLVKMAVRNGAKLCIDTDSHEVSQMDFMQFGVWTARRGWCTKSDVVNTLTFRDLQSVLRLS